MRKIIVLIMLSSCGIAQAAMFKCVDKEGKAKYQATQCPADAQVKVIPKADKVNPVEALKSKLQAEKAKEALKMMDAIKNHLVVPGMTKEQAVASVGGPSRINHGQYGEAHDEQWVYEKKVKVGKIFVNRDSYVYFKNGVLTSVQWSQ